MIEQSNASIFTGNRFLENKVAIVTGAAWGIGKSIALHLVNAGAKTVLVDIDAEGLKSSQADVDPTGENTAIVATDIRHEIEVQNAFAQAVRRFGRLDILVNNAGVY